MFSPPVLRGGELEMHATGSPVMHFEAWLYQHSNPRDMQVVRFFRTLAGELKNRQGCQASVVLHTQDPHSYVAGVRACNDFQPS